jgi:hypothetical protein
MEEEWEEEEAGEEVGEVVLKEDGEEVKDNAGEMGREVLVRERVKSVDGGREVVKIKVGADVEEAGEIIFKN